MKCGGKAACGSNKSVVQTVSKTFIFRLKCGINVASDKFSRRLYKGGFLMNSVLKHEALKSSPGRDYITEIPTNRIKANPYQPRKEFSRSALYDLANSIKEYGILQPITVRPLRAVRIHTS